MVVEEVVVLGNISLEVVEEDIDLDLLGDDMVGYDGCMAFDKA